MSGPAARALVSDIVDRASLYRVLFRMAVPTVLSGLLRSSFAFVDMLTAGRLSTDAQAGLTTAVFFAWMFHSLSSMISTGALAHVAQATGAGDRARAIHVATLALRSALSIGALCSLVFFFVAPVVVQSSGLDEGARQASMYLRVLACFGVAYWAQDALEQSLRGAGHATLPVKVAVVTATMNAILNPIFAEHLGLGLAGLALSTGIAWTTGACALAIVAHRRGLLSFRAPSSTEGAPRVGALLRVGLPVAWNGVAFDLVWVVLAPIAARTGAVTLAAIGVGHRLESIGYLTAQGLCHATASLVGQCVGAGRGGLARRIAWAGLAIGLTSNALWALCTLVFASALAALFTRDPAVQAAVVDYVAISALPMVFQAIETVLLGAFEGMAKTALPFAISLAAYAARIPIAHALVSLGAVGIFATTAITSTCAGIAMGVLFVLRGPRGSDGLARDHSDGASPARIT